MIKKKIPKLNVEGKALPNRQFLRMAAQHPIQYVDTESFIAWCKVQRIKINAAKVRKMRDGSPVAVFRGKQLVLRNNNIYVRRFKMTYGTSKGKDGRPRRANELLISSFPIPPGVQIKPRKRRS